MEIRPFRGWRYVGGLDGDVSPYVAPPYDVLNAADKQRLLDRHPNNIVDVDLPHVPPKELGPDAAYERAAERLQQWQAEGVLRQDPDPCIYVYEQAYEWAGRQYVRRAMLCGLRATELGEDVIPHEHVFAGPLADRLKLTECTRTQLSPIFGFYDDPAGAVASTLQAATDAARPVARAAIGEVTERLWAVDAPAAIDAVGEALADVPAFIADGHHRYTTARNYCTSLAKAGQIGPDHEANFVMFALVARDDPGLVILPTHRMLSNLDPAGSMEQLAEASPEFSWRPAGKADVGPAAIEALLGCAGPTAMAFVSGTDAALWIVELARPEAMAEAAPDETDTWRTLPPAILSKLVIERALRPWAGDDLQVAFTPQIREVIDACKAGRAQVGVILKSIPIDAVEDIARSGASMPHKSTYFYPKITTGMVLKPLA